MKTKIFSLLCSSICFFGCCKSSVVEGGSADSTIMQNTSVMNPIVEDSVILTDDLSQFKCVLDTLNHLGDRFVDSQYFLFDITGDGTPELWIKSGSCEANTKLLAFTCDNSIVSKIYEGAGGHSDFFIYDGQLVCVMCNTGAGGVITYHYDGKRVFDSVVYFSTWNESGEALSDPHNSVADAKLKYWEDNYENFIELKSL